MISAAQLVACGLTRERISAWTRIGRLYRIHPGVYTVGHESVGIQGRLVAALLYAGGGAAPADAAAALSHMTAAWWWGLLDTEPKRIHVSVPGRRASLPDVRVHQRRHLERTAHRGLPVTTVAQALLDVGATMRLRDLRRTVGQADFRRLLDLDAVDAVLARRQPGGAALREAVEAHRPARAHTFNGFEDLFLDICETHDIPLPRTNVKVEGILVDAFWPEQRLVVELDGRDAHSTPAQIESDRRKELRLRRTGHLVQRYTWRQLTRQAALVAEDVNATLAQQGVA